MTQMSLRQLSSYSKLRSESAKNGNTSSPNNPNEKAAHPALIQTGTFCVFPGGGSFGAYPAGVLVGWSEQGNRPNFDVVTGISTGALIAVPAFLGPGYDAHMKTFYTTLKNDDLFKVRLILGLFGDALADTSPSNAGLTRSLPLRS